MDFIFSVGESSTFNEKMETLFPTIKAFPFVFLVMSAGQIMRFPLAW
jgi:hypothetical protein